MLNLIKKIFLPSVTDNKVREIHEDTKRKLDVVEKVTSKYKEELRRGDTTVKIFIATGGGRRAGH